MYPNPCPTDPFTTGVFGPKTVGSKSWATVSTSSREEKPIPKLGINSFPRDKAWKCMWITHAAKPVGPTDRRVGNGIPNAFHARLGMDGS
jgi:hypothetical protein